MSSCSASSCSSSSSSSPFSTRVIIPLQRRKCGLIARLRSRFHRRDGEALLNQPEQNQDNSAGGKRPCWASRCCKRADPQFDTTLPQDLVGAIESHEYTDSIQRINSALKLPKRLHCIREINKIVFLVFIGLLIASGVYWHRFQQQKHLAIDAGINADDFGVQFTHHRANFIVDHCATIVPPEPTANATDPIPSPTSLSVAQSAACDAQRTARTAVCVTSWMATFLGIAMILKFISVLKRARFLITSVVPVVTQISCKYNNQVAVTRAQPLHWSIHGCSAMKFLFCDRGLKLVVEKPNAVASASRVGAEVAMHSFNASKESFGNTTA